MLSFYKCQAYKHSNPAQNILSYLAVNKEIIYNVAIIGLSNLRAGVKYFLIGMSNS